MASSKHTWEDLLLLAPPGKSTRIDRKHYHVIDDYLSVGDRVACHRSYGVIHEGIVLRVDRATQQVCIFERNKTENGIVVAPNWKQLSSQFGQLYRIDADDSDEIDGDDDSSSHLKLLRILLNKMGEKGYNPFGKNCQHLSSECALGYAQSSQSKWFGLNVVVKIIQGFGKPASAEVIEALFGGAEKIGVITVVSLHVVLFLVEYYAAYQKLKRGHITWKHFTEIMIRQFSMALFASIGSVFGGIYSACLPLKVILMVVLSIFGALVADAILDWIGVGGREECPFYRYMGWMAGGSLGFVCGCLSSGWLLEVLVACMLSFAGMGVGHLIGFSASSWLTNGKTADSKIVKHVNELKRGDHITIYEWFLHPSCHAIFIESLASDKEIKIIRNTFMRGVVEEVVPFIDGNIYRKEYHSSGCRKEYQVIEEAKSKVGDSRYNWMTYNCETFAEECKCETNNNVASTSSNAVDWDVLFAKLLTGRGGTEGKISLMMEKFHTMMRKVSCVPL